MLVQADLFMTGDQGVLARMATDLSEAGQGSSTNVLYAKRLNGVASLKVVQP